MGAQDKKKRTLTPISNELVFFLRASWRDFLCEEKTEFVWQSSVQLILKYLSLVFMKVAERGEIYLMPRLIDEEHNIYLMYARATMVEGKMY